MESLYESVLDVAQVVMVTGGSRSRIHLDKRQQLGDLSFRAPYSKTTPYSKSLGIDYRVQQDEQLAKKII